MKQKFLLSIGLSSLMISGLFLTEKAAAQSSKDEKNKTSVRIKVTEDNNGKSRTIEKNYVLPDMSGDAREDFVDKALDSLHLNADGKNQVTITIDDKKGNTITQRRKKMQKDRKQGGHDEFAFNYNGDDFKDLNFNFDELRNQTRNLEREFRPKAKIMMRDVEEFGNRFGEKMDHFWNEDMKASTVRNLNVYPNNPDNGVINLRFFAPTKGDVNVTISDTKGKEVGRKEIKDFSGEFVGQIDIKKSTKGTVFVTVTQNEDGAVKRVILP